MIKKLSPFLKYRINQFADIYEADEIYGPRIKTIYQTRGFCPSCDYYIVTDSETNAIGSITRFYGTVYILFSGSDYPEIASFLKRDYSWIAIEGHMEIINELGKLLGLEVSCFPSMIHNGIPLPVSSFKIDESRDIATFYDILCACHANFPENTNYRLWYNDYALRIDKSLTELYFLYENNIPVSCASVNVQNTQYAVLGSVSTIPEFRGKGYGTAVSIHCTNRIIKLGKTATLQCADMNLVNFYSSMGYRKSDDWGIAERS